MMTKTLSLIVPFHSEFTYLADCLDSVRAQRDDRVEIIIVNDNPGDETRDFLSDISAAYNTRVIHHEHNRGLSAARNTGIEAATGDLATFIDSDDYYTGTGLRRHLDFAIAHPADMVHTPTVVKTLFDDIRYVEWDGAYFLGQKTGVTLASWPQAQFIASSWSSIYNTRFLKGLRFDESQPRFEDRLFVLQAQTAARSLSFAGVLPGGPVRVYRRRPGSITSAAKKSEDRVLQARLSAKCVDIISREVSAGRLPPLYLQRELMISLERMLFHAGAPDPRIEPSPERDEARAIFHMLFSTHALEDATFGDELLLPISKIRAAPRGCRPVTLADMKRFRDKVAMGQWKAAGRTYDALRLPAPAPVQLEGGARKTRLTLHIGLHKTGTTHAQSSLAAARDALKAAGILFPETGFRAAQPSNARADASPGHVLIDQAIRDGDADMAEALVAEVDTHDPAITLISAENMSNPLSSSMDRDDFMVKAKAFFAPFANRHVIALYRRPDIFLDRYYRELVFLGFNVAHRPADRFADDGAALMTNLPALFGPWADFAGGALRLENYDNAAREGVTGTLLRLAGADAPIPSRPGKTYPSPSRSRVAGARLIVGAIPGGARRSAALAAFVRITEGMEDACDGPLLSAAARRRVIERLRGAPADYAARHGLDLPIKDWLADIIDEPKTVDAAFLDKARLAIDLTPEAPASDPRSSTALKLYRMAEARRRGIAARL